MKLYSVIWLLMSISYAGMAQSQPTIRVALASSLVQPFMEIKSTFEKEHDVKIELIPGASGMLTNQIINGAPYDIFVSANSAYSNMLYNKQYCDEPPVIFARGKIVIWSKIDSIGSISDLLLHNAVKTIALAHPDLAPHGQAAKNVIDEFDVWERIENKVVYANSVSLVNQFIYTGSVDLVFTSSTAKVTLLGKCTGFWHELEKFEQSKLDQTIILLNSSKFKSISFNFLQYLLQSQPQHVLHRYGLSSPIGVK